MSMMIDIQRFIARNPGITSSEIADVFTGQSKHSTQRAVCRLFETGRATRQMHDNQYRYYAVLPEESEAITGAKKNACIEKLVSVATKLNECGLYRRAATTWLEAFNLSSLQSERERFLKQRQICLRKVPKATKPEGSCYLSGAFSGEL